VRVGVGGVLFQTFITATATEVLGNNLGESIII